MMFGNYQYQYNENGIRVKKTGGGLNIKYDVDGTQVVRSTDLINNKSLIYHYDQNNQVIGLNYSGKEYMYQRNILGEICGIIDLNGKEFINYTYNAYGVPSITLGTNLNPSEMIIASDLAQLNIYLYKGYIYDNETKLYYCQTRYYDPEIGRWLSIDHIAYLDSGSIGGLNLYAYCGNNPVMYIDRDGTFPVLIIIGSILLGGLISGAFAVASESDSNNYLGAFVGGFINGTIGTAGLAAALATGGLAGFGIAFGSGFLGGAIGDLTNQLISYRNIDLTKSLIAGGISGIMNSIGYLGMYVAELVPIGTWGEKFVEAIAPTIATLSITNYLSSITPSDLYQRKGKTLTSHFMQNNKLINLGSLI